MSESWFSYFRIPLVQAIANEQEAKTSTSEGSGAADVSGITSPKTPVARGTPASQNPALWAMTDPANLATASPSGSSTNVRAV